MNTRPADPADVARRAAQALAADAAEHGIDLADPEARRAFVAGLTVSYGWITAAHETGKINGDSFSTLENLLSVAIDSLSDGASS